MKLLIIADDFTGALDTGVQFAHKGIKTLVAANSQNIPTKPDCEVLSVNLDCRHDLPDEAYIKTKSLLKSLADTEYIYLKTDSVLRGNISAGFRAVLDALKQPVMFVPAYPKMGRTTVDGRQYVNGIPIDESSFSKDPLNPIKNSFIPEILNSNYKISAAVSGLFDEFSVEDEVRIFDCDSQASLEFTADFLAKNSALHLLAGCAGLAEAMHKHITFNKHQTDFSPNDNPVLYLSGSAGETTFKQIRKAKENIAVYKIPPNVKLSPQTAEKEIEQIKNQLCERLLKGESVILAAATSQKDLVEMSDNQHNALQAVFAEIAEAVLDTGITENLAIFGGDTALAIIDRLNISFVQPISEIHAGIPLSSAKYKGNINLVTKSGGLGDENAVAVIEKYLRRYGEST